MAWIVRFLLLAAFLWLGYVLFADVQAMRDVAPDDPAYDPTGIVMRFLGIIALGIGVGVVIATTILPDLGDRIGSFFYDSGEKLERDPHKEAVALVNQGDYVAAVHAYRKIFEKNPDDLHALSEVVRIQCEKLELYDDAVEYLEGFLQDDLEPERLAFLAERLVDVHWLYKKDSEMAIPVLQQIIEALPETKYAANAYHRIHDIERAVQEAELQQRLAAHGQLTHPQEQGSNEVEPQESTAQSVDEAAGDTGQPDTSREGEDRLA